MRVAEPACIRHTIIWQMEVSSGGIISFDNNRSVKLIVVSIDLIWVFFMPFPYNGVF